MTTITYKVTGPLGLHARPAAFLAQACVNLASQITVKYDGRTASGSNVLELLALRAGKGAVLEITAEGGDEQAALNEVYRVLREKMWDRRRAPLLHIAFFGTHDYDRLFFSELAKDRGEGTYNCDIKYFSCRLTPETANLAKGFDAVCVFVNDELPRQAVETLADCGVRLILLRCAGFNNVDLQACKERGIKVARVPAYSPYAVAEHAMSLIMTANRRLHKAVNKVRDNNFALSGLLGLDLHNKVAGIVGTGKIGQCMARICKGFGMSVLAWDAYPNKALEEEGLLTYVPWEELLERSDLISLHCPLLDSTYHMINIDTIKKMKDGVILVNTSRGALVKTDDLIEGIRLGKFLGVGLDVYEEETGNVFNDRSDEIMEHSVTARLLSFPNVIVTSHQGFYTMEALEAIAETTLQNLLDARDGKKTPNDVA